MATGLMMQWEMVRKNCKLMMQPAERLYYGKLMLFGEYSVITGSPALLIPFRRYAGKWMRDASPNNPLRKSLRDYTNHLLTKQHEFSWLDIPSLKASVNDGWYFNSTIPQGYGAGSSGALVAAIYESFAFKIESDFSRLQQQLAAMESYFHGSSSGLDPLACFMPKPLLVHADKSIQFPDVSEQSLVKNTLLIDSKKTAATGPLVSFFRKQLMEYPFYKKLSGIVIPAVVEAIHAKLSGQEDDFTNALQRISSFQFENLQPMIPETLRRFWQTGLDTNQFYVKLCGSGGGGYFLLYTNNKDLLPELPKEMKLVEL